MKLEYGKRYVRRDGLISNPLQSWRDPKHPYVDPGSAIIYMENGLNNMAATSECDLISEYETPTPEVLSPLSANQIQHGGTHYKSCTIQPWDYIARNNIPYLEGSAIKYISRWRDKGGIEDLRKAIHFIEKVIELEQEPKEAVP